MTRFIDCPSEIDGKEGASGLPMIASLRTLSDCANSLLASFLRVATFPIAIARL